MTNEELHELFVHEMGVNDVNEDPCFWVIRELLEIGEMRAQLTEEHDYIANLRLEALLPRDPERSCVLAWVEASWLIESDDEPDDFTITDRGAEVLAWFRQSDAEQVEAERKLAN